MEETQGTISNTQRYWIVSIVLGMAGYFTCLAIHTLGMDGFCYVSFAFPLLVAFAYGFRWSFVTTLTVCVPIYMQLHPIWTEPAQRWTLTLCFAFLIWHASLHGDSARWRFVRHPLLTHWVFFVFFWIAARLRISDSSTIFVSGTPTPLLFYGPYGMLEIWILKNSLVLFYILIAVLAMLRLNSIRRILKLETDPHAHSNEYIVAASALIFTIAWFFMIAVKALFSDQNMPFHQVWEHYDTDLSFFVLTGLGLLFGYLLCAYSEIQSRNRKELMESSIRLRGKDEQIVDISNNLLNGMIYQILYRSATDRIFTYVSKSVERFYGITVEEAMADPSRIYSRVHPLDIDRLVKTENSALENRTAMIAAVRMFNPDGSIRWSSFVSTPKFRDDGTVLWNGIEFDITSQKTVEESLRIFKASVEESADAVGMSTPEGYHYYQNAEFTRLFGEIGADPPSTVYVDPAIGRQVFRTIMSGACWMGEVLMYSKDRSILHILLRAYPIMNDDGNLIGLAGLHTDITGRKRMEDALLVFKKSVEYSTDAIALATPEGLHYYQNAAFTSIFGEIGVMPQDVYVDRSNADEVFATIRSGRPWVGEIEMLDKSRTVIHVMLKAYAIFDEHRQIVGLAGNHTDITDRKLAEGRLRESEERLRALIDGAPFGSHQYELQPDGRLVFIAFNKSAESILGIPLSGYIGKTIEEAFPGLVDTVIPDSYREVARTGRPFNLDQIVYESDELRGAYEIYAFHTGPNRMAVFFLDITERKRSQEERERLREQLVQIQKLESIGQLAGGIAHDFNNTVQTIIGNADLAINALEPDHPVREELDEILKAAEHSAELTRQLLAFARKQPIVPKVLDLNRTIDGMLNLLNRMIGDQNRIVWEPGDSLGMVRIDSSQIQQVITNLCINARDASPSQSDIIIRTDRITVSDDGTSRYPDALPGVYIRLSVTDHGSGMDSETKGRIFEPFFTTKEAGRGTGLGLSTVYGIVRQNCGFIDVVSAPGRGSRFDIHFPIYTGDADAVPHPEPNRSDGKRDALILLVEDDPTILRVYQLMIEKLGYRVLAASTSAEAIRIAETHGREIDLLMTDMVMPGMSGKDLVDHLRSKTPGLAVLCMSGHSEDILARSPDTCSDVHFLQKPFNKQQLSDKLLEILY